MKSRLVCIVALTLLTLPFAVSGQTPAPIIDTTQLFITDSITSHDPSVTDGAFAPPNPGSLAQRDPFQSGALTFQAMTGYFLKTDLGPYGDAIDFAPVGLRLGYIVNTPSWNNCLRGCFELLVEANYSPITREYGTYFVGANALLRYNFVQPECIFVPYIQGGGGFNFNDAYKEQRRDRTLIGQEFEFLLRAELGVRYMISDRVSLDLEAGFQHISNAGIAFHNGGLNNLGASVGFTYYLGK